MSYSVLNVKSDLEGVLHGTTNNQITNLNGVINRAARQLLLDIDPQETIRTVELANPVYERVYDYVIPSDLKGTSIIDIRPQTERTLRDSFSQAYSQDFDVYKNYTLQNNFNVDFNSGYKTLRLNIPLLNKSTQINSAEDISSNGTWSVGGDAANLRVDTINFIGSVSSLSFDLVPSTNAGTLTNSTMTQQDLTAYYNEGAIFTSVYLPVASHFTSIKLDWGNDASNYYTATVTTSHDGNTFQNGWNLLRFDWFNNTTVGTPDYTKIDYVKVTYNYDGTAMSGVKIDKITAQNGMILEIEYYSKFLFRNASTGAFQETMLLDTDLINLDTETYNIFFNQVALLAVQQMLGQDATYDTSFFNTKYQEGIAQYKGRYKSQIIKPKTMYYRKPVASWRRFLGRGFNY